MTEQSILARLRRRAGAKGLVLGIGDDCAVFRPRAGEDLVFTTDLMIEGVHFLATDPPSAIGHKTLARGLSDIAAMGAEPRFFLLSLAASNDARWIGRFFDGLLKLAARHATTLAGGDLARSDRTLCDIVVCGAVPRGKEIRRNGARPGDGIFVTGPLGGAALGLETRRGAAFRRLLRPEPQIAAGLALRGVATTAMDLSDGLSIDLARLCDASGVGADLLDVPVFRGATLDHALHGGDDYELLFTARRSTALRIGTITKQRGVRWNGEPLDPRGWDHFRT